LYGRSCGDGAGGIPGPVVTPRVDKQRFTSLWKRCQIGGGAKADADDVYQEVYGYYSESGRHYHTPRHIEHCLIQFDLSSAEMDDADAVEMAIWFHDLIFDAQAPDNELQSARRFVELAGDSMDEDFKSRVYDLIMATAPPRMPKTTDQEYMLDIDLSSFGLPWADMLRDSIAVRRESADLSDADFFPGQRAFLESLVNREHFYFTEYFRSRIEETARSNINRYLENLEGQGTG
jgi:predicted metal-dependent HD superfamily phosphohydrolase